MKKLIQIILLLFYACTSFAQSTDAELTTQANVIRNETITGANTPLRIGNMFRALIDSKKNLDEAYTSTTLTTNNYAVTINPGVTGFTKDFGFYWKVNATNTSTVTIAVNGLAAKAVRKDGSAPLASGDIVAGRMYPVIYDVAQGWFQILLPGSGGGGSFTLTDGEGTTVSGSGTAVDIGGTLTTDRTIDIDGHALTIAQNNSGIQISSDGSSAVGVLSGDPGGAFLAGPDGAQILPDKSGPQPAEGSLFLVGSAGYIDDLPIGTSGQVLTSDGTTAGWETPASAGVTSVSGASNRITSTGGTTPVIDISATFEALLGKVAQRVDQNNAATTSAQLSTVLSDEEGSSGGFTRSEYMVGTQDLFISAAAMWPRVTGGCSSLTQTELSTSVFNIQSLDFDQSTDEFAQFQVTIPRKWNNGTVTVAVYWTAASGSGNVVWSINGGAYSDDDALTVALGSAQSVTDGLTATNDLMISSATAAITLAGTPADSDFLAFQVSRDADNGSDTLNGDAKLLGISIRITTDAAKDN